MNNWRATPLLEINGIKFGMHREEVRKILGNNFTEFKKNKFSKTTSDNYGFCHVYYNTQNDFVAVEIFEFSEIYVNDALLFPGTIENAKNIINNLEEDDYGYISRTQSIGICVANGQVDSILFGAKGYYS